MVQKDKPSQPVQAATAIAPALDATPPDARRSLLSHFAHNRLEQCYNEALALTALEPDHAFAWKVMGLVHQRTGRASEAQMAMRRAVQLAPQDLEARRNLASMLQEGMQVREAIEQFQAVLQFDATDLLAHAGLAQMLAYEGQLPQAITHFRQALLLRLNTVSQPAPVDSPRQPAPAGRETLLWQTLAQLAQAGVHACPTAGTLLGLERDGHLLPFDKDMDVILPFAEMALAQACLQRFGWTAKPQGMRLLNPQPYLHTASGNLLDLCGVQQEANSGQCIGGFWQQGTPWEWQRITVYPPFAIHQQQRTEGMVWALDQPHAWLDALYGDWRTPDADFDTVISARNLRGFALLTQCFALARIDNLWQHGRLRQALSQTRQTLRHLAQDSLLLRVQKHLQDALTHDSQNIQATAP